MALDKDSVLGAGAVTAAFLYRVPLQPSVKALPSARYRALGKDPLRRLKIPRELFAEGRPRQSLCRVLMGLCRGRLQ